VELDLLVYHGSEYKDYVVWSAAANVAERLGADEAYATENHTLCASTPVARASRRVGTPSLLDCISSRSRTRQR
jgi:3-oxoacyl-[acyl-carrier-protein] synthase-3